MSSFQPNKNCSSAKKKTVSSSGALRHFTSLLCWFGPNNHLTCREDLTALINGTKRSSWEHWGKTKAPFCSWTDFLCGLSGTRGGMLQTLTQLVYHQILRLKSIFYWHLKNAFMQRRAELTEWIFSFEIQRRTMTAKILDASIVWLFINSFMTRLSAMDKQKVRKKIKTYDNLRKIG